MFTVFFAKFIAFVQAIIMFILSLGPGPVIPGNSRTIALAANPSTGYTWVCEMEPEGVVKIAREYYSQEFYFPQVGMPVTYNCVIVPVADGETTLTFYYMRPWEGKDSAAQVVSQFVTVEDGVIWMAMPADGEAAAA